MKNRQDIVNSKRGIKSTDVRTLSYGTLFQDDVLNTCNLLTERGWLFKELHILDSQKEQRWGLVFAHPTRLLILQRRGWFTSKYTAERMGWTCQRNTGCMGKSADYGFSK